MIMPEAPMDKTYDPQALEAKWYDWWQQRNLFHAEPARGGEPYCIMIPPPNVTGILHMGHALNNTLQDLMVRWRRMQGRNALWIPGTDHAGIATQNVVERALRKNGQSRASLGREAFVEHVWKWREEYGGTIIHQLKRLGASCDWSRERFTMDAGLSAAVTDVFCQLYDKGLIYRGNYIVNWCPRCHTALSDEESEHQPADGKLYHIRYPLDDGSFITVATTRPETLFGDVAVAVHPDDERYRHLGDHTVRLPRIGRELKVVQDAYVDPAFGTGVVKITPAHDPNDFEVALRHKLEPLNVMHGDGRMNEMAGPYAGLDRFACRKQLLQDLEADGLLAAVEPHQHAVGHCYRCDTVVEPRLSPQWFVRMKPLAAPAIDAVRDGRVVFVPDRWEKVYLDWMTNIRDWCISRQIWWGHRIPVYACGACAHEWAARQAPDCCPACQASAERIKQDPDVLDTWFSSWLWPFSTLGWPEKTPELALYYPTHDLVTASEIIFFWVARMIMAGLAFMDEVPFKRVYIHGTVRDDRGRKMSKSLGNSIDPLSVIERFSADAMRFSLIMLTATGQDVLLSDDKFEIGRNFGTKLWNASRFIRMHLDKQSSSAKAADLDPRALSRVAEQLSDEDRYVLGCCNRLVLDCTRHLESCRFQDYALTLYDFAWHRFCDWYLEAVKPDLYDACEARRQAVLDILRYVLSVILRIAHPVIPFLTEALWHALAYGGDEDSIMVAPWPTPFGEKKCRDWGIDDALIAFVEARHDLIRAGRQLRADYVIATNQPVKFVVCCESNRLAERLRNDLRGLCALLNAQTIDIRNGDEPESPMPGTLTPLGTIYMPLAGLVDIEAETIRLDAQRLKTFEELQRVEAKLENSNFVDRAPEAVVEKQRQRGRELMEKLDKIKTLSQMLQAAVQPS